MISCRFNRRRRLDGSRRRLWVESLEARRLLAALVGVDFDTSSDAPSGWTSFAPGHDSSVISNLADEAGNVTPTDLLVVNSFGATVPFDSSESIDPGTLPTRVATSEPSLEALGGTYVAPLGITAMFSDLVPGKNYEIYVFGLEADGVSSSQSVRINGASAFTQLPSSTGTVSNLWVNGQQGSSSASLNDSAVIATATGQGEIEIVVSGSGTVVDISLGGLAIRDPVIVVNDSGGGDDNDAVNGVTTLREAIRLANATPGPDTITFDPSAFVSDTTISLGGTELEITDTLTIDASAVPGSVTIDAEQQSRVLNFSASTGDLSLNGLTLTGGTVGSSGGGVLFSSNGTLSLNSSTVSGNTSGNSGGGIRTTSGSVSLVDSNVSDNTSSLTGGGIATNVGEVVLNSSTVSGNATSFDGGGVFTSFGEVSLTSSTVTGNTASGFGGGIYVASTVASPNFTVENSIVAGNSDNGTAPDLKPDSSSPLIINHSLIGATALNVSGTNNQVGTLASPIDPILGPLGDNGGPTLTHALIPGSPAIDAGNDNVSETHDQRGFPRNVGGVDIGAVEVPVAIVVNELGDSIATSGTTFRKAIIQASVTPGFNSITFDNSVFGVEQTIELDLQMTINDAVAIVGPGSDLLTIDAGDGNDGNQGSHDGFRVFFVDDHDDTNQLPVSISGLTLTGGDVNGSGGGIWNSENLQANDLIIRDNSASGSGAGIRNLGTLELNASTISGNTSSGNGGGIHNSGDLSVVGSSLIDNHAAQGGGVFSNSDTVVNVEITHSTISGNTASNLGGGIRSYDQSTVSLTSSTVTDNIATSRGGGLDFGGVPVTLNNSIIAGNSANANPDANVNATGVFNLIGDGAGLSGLTDGVAGNQIGTMASPIDPLLGRLADNGGPTQTHALLAGSSAIDAVSLVAPISATMDAGNVSMSGFDVENLIDGSGLLQPLRLDNYELQTHAASNTSNAWRTDREETDYFADGGIPPELTFTLPTLTSLSDVVLWGFEFNNGSGKANEAKALEVSFSEDGGTTFGDPVTLTHELTGLNSDTIRLGDRYLADQVKIKVIDNHFGTPGAGGGSRVALGEVRFIGTPVIEIPVIAAHDQRGAPFARKIGFAIDIGAFESQGFDFGDAPAGYPTTLANRGASHVPVGPSLGPTRDVDADGAPSTNADGDDLAGIDDEDSVLFGRFSTDAVMAALNVDVQNANEARVDAWIDFNQDGDWEDEGEQILNSRSVIPGLQTLNFNVAPDAIAGDTFARVRISSAGGLGPDGPAADGEVEDYRVTVGTPPKVEEIQINDGSDQRSRIESLQIRFDRIVEISDTDAAFVISRIDSGQSVARSATLSTVDNKTVVELLFDQGAPSVEFGSLSDGNYQLVIQAAMISSEGFVLDGDDDGLAGGDSVDEFFRLFGDTDGDRDVDGQDYGRFGLSFLKSDSDEGFNTNLDFDNDGDVDGQDYGQFGLRFLTTLES